MKHRFVGLLLLFFSAINLPAQQLLSEIQDPEGKYQVNKIKVQKGQTLSDFLDISLSEEIQTDIDPGISPEGDYLFQPAFTPDGTKVIVPNGGTDNVTIYDYETMEAIEIIDVGDYPCDVATTDDYAIIPCIFGDEILVIDLDDYTIAATFFTPAGAQPCVVETSADGQYAYVACDINDQCEVIDLTNLTQLDPIEDFPVGLLTFSWISTGGRSSFSFSRFQVTPDGSYLVVGDAVNDVLFIDPLTGAVDFSVADIPNCFVTCLSGDGSKTIALSDENNEFNAFQIDNTTHEITAQVTLTDNYMALNDVVANMEGSKAFVGIGNNSSAIVRFETSDFITFTQTYTPFWMGISSDHQYAISGQYRLSVMDFESETMEDQLQGYTQSIGCVSPVDNKLLSFDPLRYEGVYFFDFEDPEDIQYNGKTIGGWPQEGDTPYRIAISPDGTRAVTSNSISENISIINMETYEVEAILEMEESCDALAITHDSQWAIMGGYDLNTIKIIDLLTNEYVTSVYTGQRPLMVSIAPDDSYAYIGNLKQNSVSFVELDGENSSEVVEIPTGIIGLSWAAFGVRSSVEVDPTGQYVLVAASFNDMVQVIDVEQQEIVANLNVGVFPLKIVFNATGEYAAVTNYSGDTYSILQIDGANSSVVGTFNAGDGPLRLAYNPVNDEFGIINYSTKSVMNVDPVTGEVNSTDYYTQYGNPIQILYDTIGNPIVLTMSTDNAPGHIIRNSLAIELPATPSYFDYCPATHTAVVCMPGPDYVSVIEFDQSLVPPIADFVADITEFEYEADVSFTDLSENSPSSWSWEFQGGDPATSTEQNPVIYYGNMFGEFDVKLVATNNNGSNEIIKEDYITVLLAGQVGEDSDLQDYIVYPNPMEEFIILENPKNIQDQCVVSIFNGQGRLMLSEKVNMFPTQLDVSFLNEGVYLLKINVKEKEEIHKLIKK